MSIDEINFFIKWVNNGINSFSWRMFIFERIEGNDSSFSEFEITGSTYEPIGDVFLNGQKVKGQDFETLHELSTICIMCNDSSIDFNEVSYILKWKVK